MSIDQLVMTVQCTKGLPQFVWMVNTSQYEQKDFEALMYMLREGFQRFVFPTSLMPFQSDLSLTMQKQCAESKFKTFQYYASMNDIEFLPSGMRWDAMYPGFEGLDDLSGGEVVKAVTGRGLSWKDIQLLSEWQWPEITQLAVYVKPGLNRISGMFLGRYDDGYAIWCSCFMGVVLIVTAMSCFEYGMQSRLNPQDLSRASVLLGCMVSLLSWSIHRNGLWPFAGYLESLGKEDAVVHCHQSDLIIRPLTKLQNRWNDFLQTRLELLAESLHQAEEEYIQVARPDWNAYMQALSQYAQSILYLLWTSWIVRSNTATLFVVNINDIGALSPHSVPKLIEGFGCNMSYLSIEALEYCLNTGDNCTKEAIYHSRYMP